MGWGRGEVRGGRAALGGRGLEGCPRVGAESAAIWASHGEARHTPPPAPARLSSLAGSVWGRRRRRQREQAGVLGTQARQTVCCPGTERWRGGDGGTTVEQGMVPLGREG